MFATCSTAFSALLLLVTGAGEPSWDEIHARWRDRTERTRSMRLTYEETRGSTKVPGLQLTFGRSSNQVRMLNEMHGPRLPGQDMRDVSTFDGTEGRTFFSPAQGKTGSGNVWPNFVHSFFQVPVIHALRPLESGLLELTLDKYLLTSRTEDVNGVRCLVLEEPAGARSPGLSSKVLVDPDRDFVPCRLVEMFGGQAGAEYTCDFERHSSGVFLPSNWDARFSDSERVAARVTKIETGQALPDSEFAIQFPPNTLINDRIRGEEYYIDVSGKKTLPPAPVQGRVRTEPAFNREWLLVSLIVAAVLGSFCTILVLERRRRLRFPR